MGGLGCGFVTGRTLISSRRAGSPALFPESLPCTQKMLAFELLFLSRTPCLDGADGDLGILTGLLIVAHDPMDGAEKLKPERIFKTLD